MSDNEARRAWREDHAIEAFKEQRDLDEDADLARYREVISVNNQRARALDRRGEVRIRGTNPDGELLEATTSAAAIGLPSDAQARKETPIYSGVLRYFPLALAAVAQCSKVGNDQHNPGEPLHWAREKSTDEHDALVRHLLESGTRDTDGIRHTTKAAWRALAALQKEIESDGGEL